MSLHIDLESSQFGMFHLRLKGSGSEGFEFFQWIESVGITLFSNPDSIDGTLERWKGFNSIKQSLKITPRTLFYYSQLYVRHSDMILVKMKWG